MVRRGKVGSLKSIVTLGCTTSCAVFSRNIGGRVPSYQLIDAARFPDDGEKKSEVGNRGCQRAVVTVPGAKVDRVAGRT